MGEPTLLAYKVEVLGHVWVVHYWSKRAFKKKYSGDTYGVTECDDKEIHLRTDRLKRETIVHEMAHAYIWELGAAVAGLDSNQLEEIYCEMLAKYGLKIHATADEILMAYKILKGRSEETR